MLNKALATKSLFINNVTNKFGNILHQAASFYDSNILELLLSNFVDESMVMLFEKNEEGETPLFSAIEQDLEKNADLLLTFAQERKKELLASSNAKNKCVLDTAWRGSMRGTLQKHCQPFTTTDFEVLTRFCSDNANVLPRVVRRLTCQCEPALAQSMLSTVLSKMGGSLCSVEVKGRNSAHIAVREEDIQMLSLLLNEARTDDELLWKLISAQDSKGRTSWHYAMMDNSVQRITSVTVEIDGVKVGTIYDAGSQINQPKHIVTLLRDAAQKLGKLEALEAIKDNENKSAAEYLESSSESGEN